MADRKLVGRPKKALRKLIANQGKHYFVIWIFETRKDLQEAEKKYSPKDFSEGTMACVMPQTQVKIYPNGTEKLMPKLGWVFFSFEDLCQELIAHEAVHMALAYERIVLKNRKASFGLDIGEKEERFAYLLGQLVESLQLLLSLREKHILESCQHINTKSKRKK